MLISLGSDLCLSQDCLKIIMVVMHLLLIILSNVSTLFEDWCFSFWQERDKVVRWTNLVDIFCGLTFYPLEHVAWARDKKLLAGKSEKLWDLSLYTWIGSLIACIIRDLWLLRKLQHLQKSRSVSSLVMSYVYC